MIWVIANISSDCVFPNGLVWSNGLITLHCACMEDSLELKLSLMPNAWLVNAGPLIMKLIPAFKACLSIRVMHQSHSLWNEVFVVFFNHNYEKDFWSTFTIFDYSNCLASKAPFYAEFSKVAFTQQSDHYEASVWCDVYVWTIAFNPMGTACSLWFAWPLWHSCRCSASPLKLPFSSAADLWRQSETSLLLPFC